MTDYIKRDDVLRIINEYGSQDSSAKLLRIAALPSVPVSEERAAMLRELEVAEANATMNGDWESAFLCAARLLRAPQQGEPVAWGIRTTGDGSWRDTIAPVGWITFTALLAKMRDDGWVKAGRAVVVPLFAAPPPDDEAVRLLREAMQEMMHFAVLDRFVERIRAYLARKEQR